jgi:RNAse (barnase) inhibitor barstar
MGKPKFILDGNNFKTLEEFYDEIAAIFSLPSWWGRNLDAFNDVLRSDFMPDHGYIIIWKNSHLSKQFLGYEETVRQLTKRLERGHPDNVLFIQKQIDEAKRRIGPTVFDWLAEIIRNHCLGGNEEEDNAELILELS